MPRLFSRVLPRMPTDFLQSTRSLIVRFALSVVSSYRRIFSLKFSFFVFFLLPGPEDLLAFYFSSLRLRDSCFGREVPRDKDCKHLYPSMAAISSLVFPKRKAESLAPRAPARPDPVVSRPRAAVAEIDASLPTNIAKSRRADVKKSPTAQSMYVFKQEGKPRSALLPASMPVSVDAAVLFSPLRRHVFRALRASAAKGAKHDHCVSLNTCDGVLDAILRAAGVDSIPVLSKTAMRRVRVRFSRISFAFILVSSPFVS